MLNNKINLAEHNKKFLNKIKAKNNIKKYNKTFLKDFKLKIYINDLELKLSLGLFEECFKIEHCDNIDNADVSLSSEALTMLFQNDFSSLVYSNLFS